MTMTFEYRTSVKPDWIDHNGHMNVAYYVVAFDEATDAVYEHWGIGLDYPNESGCSVFTLGINVDYCHELFAGDHIRTVTTLVDCDEKRIHYFHEMYKEDGNILAARNECLCMNVELETRQAQPFPQAAQNLLDEALSTAPSPDGFSRTLAIRRRP